MNLVANFRISAFILILVISIIIIILTFFKMKGKLLFRIAFSLLRGPIFFILFYLPFFKQPRISDSIAFPIIGCTLFVIGITISIVGIKQLLKTNLSGVKGIPEKLITIGLYNIIRHPINLGLMLTLSGWYILFSGLYSIYFLLIFLIFFIFETFWEEQNLVKTFGEQYLEYKKKVGMFLPKFKSK